MMSLSEMPRGASSLISAFNSYTLVNAVCCRGRSSVASTVCNSLGLCDQPNKCSAALCISLH